MASNYAFHFHMALNFRLYTLKNDPASGSLELRPWTPLGDFRPPDPLIWPPISLRDELQPAALLCDC